MVVAVVAVVFAVVAVVFAVIAVVFAVIAVIFAVILGYFRSFFTSDSSDKIVMTFYLKSHLFISSATSQPILRWSHHRSRHSNAPQPPMLIVSYNNTVREKSCNISQRLHNSLSTSLSTSLNKLSPACVFF